MQLSYGQIYESWLVHTSPSPTTARMVRTTLKYVARSLGGGDWRTVVAVPQAHALVQLDAATAAAGLSSQSRCNYRSYLRRLYRSEAAAGIGIKSDGETSLWPLPPTTGVHRRVQLAHDRFVRWAIGRNLWPRRTRPQDLQQWATDQRMSGNAHWRQDYRRLGESWAALASTGDLRPLAFLPLPHPVTARYAVDLADWPAHLRRQWAEMCREAAKPLRRGGLRPWREQTRRGYEERLGRFLGWLIAEPGGVEDLQQETWETLLSAGRCQAFLNWLVGRHGKTTLNPSHTSFLRMARGFHRFLFESDPVVIRAFNELAQRCEVEARDRTPRMVSYEKLAAAAEGLIAAATASARTARPTDKMRLATAVLQVDAIVLGLLVSRALRSSNLRGIASGRNLVRVEDGFELRFAATEMKGHRRFETTVPVELVPIMEDYLHHGYENLTGRAPADGDFLLVDHNGQPLTSGWLTNRVRRLTQRMVGKPVNPHFFRHIIATHAAQTWKITPTELAAFLGHRSAMTVMEYYEITSPARAAARLDEFRRPMAL